MNEDELKDAAAHAAETLAHMRMLTKEQRLEIMEQFCMFCGSDDPRCVCMRDE